MLSFRAVVATRRALDNQMKKKTYIFLQLADLYLSKALGSNSRYEKMHIEGPSSPSFVI